MDASAADVILLDTIELLFDVSFNQDPLQLQQGFSPNKAVVVAWNGTINGGYMVYATPTHPEYKQYKTHKLLMVTQAT